MSTPRSGLLRNVSFLILWSGQLLSQAGTSVLTVAFLWEAAHSGPGFAGIGGLVLTLPQLLSLVAGPIADRVHRIRLMQSIDFARALLAGGGAVLAAMPHVSFWWLAVVVFGLGAGGSLFSPAAMAVLPSVVADADLAGANGLNIAGTQVASFVGYLCGGLLVALGGLHLALLVDAVSFAFSVVSLALVRSHGSPAPPTDGGRLAGPLDGLRLALRDSAVRTLLTIGTVTNLLFAPMVVGIVVLARALHFNPSAYAALEATWSLGGLVGAALAGTAVSRLGALRVVGPVGAAGGVFLIAAAFIGGGAPAAVGLFVGAGTNAMANTVWFTWVQRRIPDHLRGAVLGVAFALLGTAVPAGIALYTPLSGVLPAGAALVLAGVSLLGSGLLFAVPGPARRLLIITFEHRAR